MAGQKPWEKYGSPPVAGPVTLGTPSPKAILDIERQRQIIANDAIDRQIKGLQITKMSQELQAANGGPPMDPALDKLTGDEFLKHLKPADAATVKALAAGRMAFPAGAALRSPYWQTMLNSVAHYDPEFDAVNYNARAATRRDFTAGKSAQNIKALNTAIGHVGQLYDQIGGTASHGGFPLATTVNSVQNAYNRGSGDSGVTKFEQTASAVASELTQVFRGSGGAEADVKRYLSELSVDASEEQKKEAVKNIVGLLNSRLEAIGDQYTKGMGTSAQPLKVLDAHAQHFLDKLGGGSGTPPPPPGGGGPTKTGQFYDPTGGGGGSGGSGVAGDQFRTEHDPKTSALLDALIRSGASADQINNALKAVGTAPVSQDAVSAAQTYLKQHPDYKGLLGDATRQVPNTTLGQISASAPAAAVGAAGNAITLGLSDELAGGASYLAGGDYSTARDAFDAKKKAMASNSPISSAVGGIAGSALSFAAPEFALGKLGLGARGVGILAPRAIAGDALMSSLYGAGEDNQNRLGGALAGGALGGIGGIAGRGAAVPLEALGRTAPVQAASRQVRGLFGRPYTAPPPSLGAGEQSVLGAANKAGIPEIQAQLDEARTLGVPMSLADTHPELRSLAGAAVRRSPTASQVAESALIPRSRGQIDRFGQAVERDLGPIANVPQLSADLAKKAKADAGPLYDQAYAANGVNSPEIDALLATPFGKDALGRARTIAGNERVDPNSLGIDLNAQGEPILTRVPSMQTLDYAKKGMDDVLEQYRTPFGKLELTPAGNAQNAVKSDLLSEIDRLNPAYKAARAAYAGPMQSRDALNLGRESISMNPDALGVGIAGKSPEQLGQIQLGYRSSLMDQANKVRYATNPFETTLGTPAAEQRLGTVYAGNPNVPRLLRQRDIESSLARTTNDILGNSKTAQRGIADAAFGDDGLVQAGLDVGINLATGQVPIGTAVKGLGKLGLKDMMKLGIGKKAVARADEIAPLLLNTDPAAGAQSIADIMARSQAYRDAVISGRVRLARPLGMFGGASALQAGQ